MLPHAAVAHRSVGPKYFAFSCDRAASARARNLVAHPNALTILRAAVVLSLFATLPPSPSLPPPLRSSLTTDDRQVAMLAHSACARARRKRSLTTWQPNAALWFAVVRALHPSTRGRFCSNSSGGGCDGGDDDEGGGGGSGQRIDKRRHADRGEAESKIND